MTSAAIFAPFELVEGDRAKGMLILVDHAKRDLPDEYGGLGIAASEFERHIAYDIGAENVSRRLGAALGVPVLMANFSRLLIDPNRGEDDPTLVRQLYDGTVIPANYPLALDERARRLNGFYRPYHEAAGALVASVARESGRAPFIIAMHSFTPSLRSNPRPWHVGVLWDLDDRAARPLIEALASDASLIVGDNQPYDGALRGDTMYRHAIVDGYPHALIELRQDLIADDRGAAAWAGRLAPILDALNARPDIHAVEHFGSRTGPVIGIDAGQWPK